MATTTTQSALAVQTTTGVMVEQHQQRDPRQRPVGHEIPPSVYDDDDADGTDSDDDMDNDDFADLLSADTDTALPIDPAEALIELRRRMAAGCGQEPLVRASVEFADDQADGVPSGEEREKSRASEFRSLNKVVGTRRLIQRIGRVSSGVGRGPVWSADLYEQFSKSTLLRDSGNAWRAIRARQCVHSFLPQLGSCKSRG